MKLNFKITFKKGIAGVENDLYNTNAKDCIYCSVCGKQFKEGDIYYYWVYDENSNEPHPSNDEPEYLLCTKCVSHHRSNQ